jgi:hypothetical protein
MTYQLMPAVIVKVPKDENESLDQQAGKVKE